MKNPTRDRKELEQLNVIFPGLLELAEKRDMERTIWRPKIPPTNEAALVLNGMHVTEPRKA